MTHDMQNHPTRPLATRPFCDRVRARKNRVTVFSPSKNSDRRPIPVGMRPTRDFDDSHTNYTQLYPQVMRCNWCPKRIILYPFADRPPTCRVSFEKTKHKSTRDFKPFSRAQRVELSPVLPPDRSHAKGRRPRVMICAQRYIGCNAQAAKWQYAFRIGY